MAYDIAGLPSGAHYIAAMLVETGSPSAPPYPSAGDLVLAPQPLQLQPGTTTLDLTLSDRWP